MKIRTVKGITEAENFNYVDAHTHVCIKREESRNKNFISEESDFPLIKSCIDDFKACSGSLLVDCTPYGCIRDLKSGSGYGGFFNKLKNYLSSTFKDLEITKNMLGANAVRFLSVT